MKAKKEKDSEWEFHWFISTKQRHTQEQASQRNRQETIATKVTG